MMASAVSVGVLAVKTPGQGQPGASLLQRQEDVALAAEVHEIALPVAELAAQMSLGGPLMDRHAVGDGWLSPAVSSPAAPLRLALREIARQSGLPAGRAVDVAVDGLRADAVVHGVQLHPPGDLFRRPSHGKAVPDVIAQAGGALDLRAAQFADPGDPIGAVRSIVSGAAVAGDLSVDRPAMPTKPAGDLTGTKGPFPSGRASGISHQA